MTENSTFITKTEAVDIMLLRNPNRITPFFNDNKKMKCPFILISTGLNEDHLAANTFQIERIHTYPKYAQCWEWAPQGWK